MGIESVPGMKVEEVEGKIETRRGEGCEPKPKIGPLFGRGFYRYFYLSSVNFGHFCMVVQPLNSGLT